MKKTCIILILALLINGLALAQMTFRPQGWNNPFGIRLNSQEDSLKKKSPRRPGFPGAPKPRTPKKQIPVGTMRVSTSIPCEILFDKETIPDLTANHLLIIYNVRTGKHELTFKSQNMDRHQTVLIDEGKSFHYFLRNDSTIGDSSIPREKQIHDKRQKIVTRYIPFKSSLSFECLPGVSINGQGAGFNGRFQVGFGSQNLRIGLGTGYLTYSKNVHLDTLKPVGFYVIILIPEFRHLEYTSDPFNVSFVPLYLNFTWSMIKKRVTPFISVDGGLSFPMATNISVKSTITFHETTPYDEYLKIDQVKMGAYFGMAFGLKYYVTPMIETGLSCGFDACVNRFTGYYYEDPEHTMKREPNNAVITTAGFLVSFRVGVNLDLFK